MTTPLTPERAYKEAEKMMSKALRATGKEREDLQKKIWGEIGAIRKKKKRAPKKRRASLRRAEEILRDALKKI